MPDVHLIRCQKVFVKINTPFLIKVLERLEMQGTHCQIKEVICNIPVDHIKLNGKKFKTILIKYETIQGYSISPYEFSIVLEVLARIITQMKMIKKWWIIKEEKEGML